MIKETPPVRELDQSPGFHPDSIPLAKDLDVEKFHPESSSCLHSPCSLKGVA